MNKSGVLRGAKAKLDSKIIDKDNFYTIRGILSKSRFDAFCPVLYIIQTEKVIKRCFEVPSPYRANNKSVEYRIEDLHPDEYQAIFFKDVLNGVINIVDKEVKKYK
jgi:hypothetical protein